jgi:hypothetical protein
MPVAEYGTPNWWLTCLLVDAEEFGADRDRITRAPRTLNIEARPT